MYFRQIRDSLYMRILSSALVISLIVTSNAWAFPGRTLFSTKSHAQRYVKTETEENLFDIKENPSVISIPSSYGEIVESYKGGGDALVVHIQDRHVDETCQLNIVKILRRLAENYDMRLLCLEGASRRLDASFYNSFQDGAIKERVSRLFVKKGLFTGPEYFKICNRDLAISAFGVEDKRLYIEHLRSYFNLQPDKEKILSLLYSLASGLYNIKRAIYSQPLKELDRENDSYRHKRTTLPEHASYLAALAHRLGIDITRYENFANFVRLSEREKEIDFEKAEKQREVLINELGRKLKHDELKRLLKLSLDFRTGKVSAVAFYAYLQEFLAVQERINEGTTRSQSGKSFIGGVWFLESADYRLSPADYSELLSYIDYINLSASIDHFKLFDDVEYINETVGLKLCETQDQRTAFLFSKNINLLQDLYNLQLTPKKLAQLQHNPAEFDIARIASFVIDRSHALGINTAVDGDLISLNAQEMKVAQEFYRLATERDIAIVDNTVRRLPFSSNKTAVLITGGFHTAGITRLLMEKDISYVVICPKVGLEDYDALYADVMRGRLPDYTSMLQGLFEALGQPLAIGDVSERHTGRVAEFFNNLFTAAKAAEASGAGMSVKELRRRIASGSWAITEALIENMQQNEGLLDLAEATRTIEGIINKQRAVEGRDLVTIRPPSPSTALTISTVPTISATPSLPGDSVAPAGEKPVAGSRRAAVPRAVQLSRGPLPRVLSRPLLRVLIRVSPLLFLVAFVESCFAPSRFEMGQIATRAEVDAALKRILSVGEIRGLMLRLVDANISRDKKNAFIDLFIQLSRLAKEHKDRTLVFEPGPEEQAQLASLFGMFSKADLFPMEHIKILTFTPQDDGTVAIDIEFDLSEEGRKTWHDGIVKYYLHEYETAKGTSELWIPEGNMRIIYTPRGYIEQQVFFMGIPRKGRIIRIGGPSLAFDKNFAMPRAGGKLAEAFGRPHIQEIMLITKDDSTFEHRKERVGKRTKKIYREGMIGIWVPGLEHVEAKNPLYFGVRPESHELFTRLVDELIRQQAERAVQEQAEEAVREVLEQPITMPTEVPLPPGTGAKPSPAGRAGIPPTLPDAVATFKEEATPIPAELSSKGISEVGLLPGLEAREAAALLPAIRKLVAGIDREERPGVMKIAEVTAPAAQNISKGQRYRFIIERGLIRRGVFSKEITRIFGENYDPESGEPTIMLVLDITEDELTHLFNVVDIELDKKTRLVIKSAEEILGEYPTDREKRLTDLVERLSIGLGRDRIGIAANPLSNPEQTPEAAEAERAEFNRIFERLDRLYGVKARTQLINNDGIVSLHDIMEELVRSMLDRDYSGFNIAAYILDMLPRVEPTVVRSVEAYIRVMEQILPAA